MAQGFATQFYKSSAWLKNRKNYLRLVLDTSGNVLVSALENGEMVYRRKDGTVVPPSMVVPPGMCERCFAMGKLSPAKLVHHKEHLTPQNITDKQVTLGYDNLQRLCQDCHAVVHGYKTESRVEFAEDGSIIPKKETLQEMVMRLTETVDERRNIHTGGKN